MRFGKPPAPPFRREFWRSPLRGTWLTAVFGSILLVGIPIVFITGLLSYAAYNPDLAGNDRTPGKGVLGFFLFDWPTSPHWLYRANQGIHVTLGLVLIPILLAKLWSVIPKLFSWPPIKSPAQLLERLSLLLLVGGAVFEFVTGVLNIQYFYAFPGSFYTLHYYGAWVFTAGFVSHVLLKFPTMWRALRGRRLRDELRVDTEHTVPEAPDDSDLVSPNPAPATISRRGVLGLVGASSLTLFALTVGQSIGGAWRKTALLAPRNEDPGTGPNGFQINKKAVEAGITEAMVGGLWRLKIQGATEIELTRAQLLAMPQHSADLPIACVEGWSTDDQRWTGVRLRDLAALAGRPSASSVLVVSLQAGESGMASLRNNQIVDGDSLLAVQVNGADLSLDHGYPARVIVPDNPGVHNIKWVTRMSFEA
jgi:DMSO/TMAO reductase YedYZ molybdopterin-dependent catalytic subunit